MAKDVHQSGSDSLFNNRVMSLPKNHDQSKTNPTGDDGQPMTCDTETECAILTGVGRSAIAVISVCGPNAESIVSGCFESATKTRFLPHQIRYGVWRGLGCSGAGESVVVTPIEQGNHFEIHCHGGPAATTRIIEDLTQAGAVLASNPPGKAMGLVGFLPTQCELHVEAKEVLSRCLTSRTAAIALDQLRGALYDWVCHSRQRLEADTSATAQIIEDVGRMLPLADFGTRLAEPFSVVLAGPPNVGKSSLLNAIVGYDRSITMDIAGTTRDILHADTVIDGLPIRLSDTAGIRDSNEPIERQGIEKTYQAARSADLVIRVAQPIETVLSATDFTSDTMILGTNDLFSPSEEGPAKLHVLNKSDLIPTEASVSETILLTNALNGDGISELMSAISQSLIMNQPEPGSPVPITNRQVKLLNQIVSLAHEGDQALVLAKLQELCGSSITASQADETQ